MSGRRIQGRFNPGGAHTRLGLAAKIRLCLGAAAAVALLDSATAAGSQGGQGSLCSNLSRPSQRSPVFSSGRAVHGGGGGAQTRTAESRECARW